MDVTIARNTLSGMLARCASISKEKSPLAYLQYVRVSLAGGRLTASATNLTSGVETSSPVDVKKDGPAFAVDAGKVSAIAKSLPAGEVRLRVVGDHLELSVGKAKFKLAKVGVDDLTPIPMSVGAAHVAAVSGADLARLINQTVFCIEPDESKPNNCILFESSPDAIRAYSAVSSRMATSVAKVDASKATLMIPAKAAAEVRSLADASKDEPVQILSGSGHAFFVSGSTTLSVKLGDGWTHPVQKALDISVGRTKHWCSFDREELSAAIQRVALTASKHGNETMVYMTFADGEVRISGASSDSEGEDVVMGDCAATCRIAFQPSLIVQAIKVVQSDAVMVGVGGSDDPGLFRPMTGDEYTSIVMPMRQ